MSAPADEKQIQKQASSSSSKTDTQKPPRQVLMLRLRREDEEVRHRRRVSWVQGVPEFPGQKSSKKCCQFHRKRLFGESDSDEHHSDHDGDSYDSDYDLSDLQQPAPQGDKPKATDVHRHRPKCTKDACFCDTRFA